MKTWSCPKKIQARTDTILSQPKPTYQYWSMAGLCTTPDCEVDQLLSEGFIRPDQFHGVELFPKIYTRNKKAWPHLNWHLGDFFTVMRQAGDFKPSLVNADLLNTPDTGADYVARLLYLLLPYKATLIANLILETHDYRCTPDQAITKLSQCQQFRYAMRGGYRYNGKCYRYLGTGNKTRTVMGTFIFDKL